MVEYQTIRVQRPVYETLKAEKEQTDETWSEFLNELQHSETEDASTLTQPVEVDLDSEEIIDGVVERLDECITVDVDLSDESNLTEARVEEIVTEEIRRSVHPKARDEL